MNSQILSDLKARIQDELAIQVSDLGETPEESAVEKMISDIFELFVNNQDDFSLSKRGFTRLRQEIVDDFLHYGPLQPFLADPSITEVCANGADNIFIEVGGKMQVAEGAAFDNEAHLRRIIDRIGQGVNRRCDDHSPIMDARLPDGSRVNATIFPIALDGSSLTIRKFPTRRMTATDFIDHGSASPAMMNFLAAAVAGRCSIIVAGGAGSGKTTLLNVLSHAIPDNERIITIEDSAELQLSQSNLVRMESRPANIEGAGQITIHALARNALRQRPDRIVIGECRDIEALEMLNAMTTGHDGSLTTVHANDVLTTFLRLEDMVRRCGIGYDSATIKRLISQAVNLIVIVQRFADGSRKIVSITALTGTMEGEVISKEELFRYVPTNFAAGGKQLGSYQGCGFPMDTIINRINSWGHEVDESWFFDNFDPDEGGDLA